MNLVLPLYCMRDYVSLSVEGNYKIITSYRGRYVLDYVSSELSDYSDRRVRLLADSNRPYKAYPINKIAWNIEQAVSSKTSTFYTDQGKLLKLKKTKFYDIEPCLIQTSWITDLGTVALQIKDVGVLETLQYRGEKYALMILFGNTRLLYGFTDEPSESQKRIKL